MKNSIEKLNKSIDFGMLVVQCRLVDVSFLSVTRVRCSVQQNSTLLACEKSVSRFSPCNPVSCCTCAGSMRGGPYCTSRENSLVNYD